MGFMVAMHAERMDCTRAEIGRITVEMERIGKWVRKGEEFERKGHWGGISIH